MSRIPATARALRFSACALHKCVGKLEPGNGARLLLFYSVECAMKERFLKRQLASPHGDTSQIPDEAFGSGGHDLDAGRKALRAPAPFPRLQISPFQALLFI